MPGDRLFRSIAHRVAGDGQVLPDEGRLGSFDRATGWLNSPPLTPDDLAGRVVLVDFWTYTCVNWLRTLPYLRAWHTAYADAGLTIVGVHTPEFDFEGDVGNVAAHTRDLDLEFPVALDADYGVWGEFANHYWPAVYLADTHGRIRFHHFGEGEYAMTEMAIQQLLREAGSTIIDAGLASPRASGLEVAADWSSVRSPETYLGYGQSRGFASERSELFDGSHVYPAVGPLLLNTWNLTGEWTVARHAAVANAADTRIAFAFHARDANLVMAPPPGSTLRFRVLLDGSPPAAGSLGTDVDGDGCGVLDRADTFQLIRQTGPIADRTIEIVFDDPGARAYCFTFG